MAILYDLVSSFVVVGALLALIHFYRERLNASRAKRHLAVALHLLTTGKNCEHELTILQGWISSWLDDSKDDAFKQLCDSRPDYLSMGNIGPAKEPLSWDPLYAIVKAVRNDQKRGFSPKTIADQYTTGAAHLLGRVESVGDQCLTHVARSARRQAVKAEG